MNNFEFNLILALTACGVFQIVVKVGGIRNFTGGGFFY